MIKSESGFQQLGYDEWGRDPKAPFLTRFTAMGIAGFLRGLYTTFRISCLQPEIHKVVYAIPGGTYIGVFWHNQIMFPSVFYWGVPRACLASRSRDGELLARVMSNLESRCVRGSSSSIDGRDKGGASGLRVLMDAARAGYHMIVTPDGPKGPSERVKLGVIILASLTGKVVYPLGFASNRYIRLNTWDRTIVPFPFSRLVLSYGEPVSVPRTNDPEILESYRWKLEQRLYAANEEARAALTQAGS